SGFLGGASDEDSAKCITADAAGAAYVGGSSNSTEFPVTVGAFDTTLDGTPSDEGEYSANGFVAKVRPDGSGFVWVTFLGGDGHDEIDGIALDSQGRVVVGGWTG